LKIWKIDSDGNYVDGNVIGKIDQDDPIRFYLSSDADKDTYAFEVEAPEEVELIVGKGYYDGSKLDPQEP